QWGPKRYLFLVDNSPHYKNTKKAEELVKRGLEKHPYNPDLNKYLAKKYFEKKKWKKAIRHWNTYFDYSKQVGLASDYLQLATSYEKAGKFKASERIIIKGLECYPRNKELEIKYYNAAVFCQKWKTAIKRINRYTALFKHEHPYNAQIKLSMVQQITGEYEEARKLFAETIHAYEQDLKHDKYGYRKI